MKKNKISEELHINAGSTSEDFDKHDASAGDSGNVDLLLTGKENRKRKTKKRKVGAREILDEDGQLLSQVGLITSSSLFHLEMQELLRTVRVQHDKLMPFSDNEVKQISRILQALPEHQFSLSDFDSDLRRSILMRPTAPETFRFLPPRQLQAVGSFPLRTVCKPALNVDIALVIPKEVFLTKDFANYKCFHKRAAYAVRAAAALRSSQRYTSVRIDHLHGDPDKPYVLINAGAQPGSKRSDLMLRLIPCLEPNTFPGKMLHPTRNNVRPKLSKLTDDQDHDAPGQHNAHGQAASLPPTPMYNNQLAAEMLVLPHWAYVQSRLQALPELRDAVVLLKSWLRRRGLHGCPDSLSASALVIITGHLYDIQRIGPSFTPYNIARAFLDFVAHVDVSNPVAMRPSPDVPVWDAEQPNQPQPSSGSDSARPWLSGFLQSFPVVFLDPSGAFNLTANMSRSSFHELRSEAQRTLRELEGGSPGGFERGFVEPIEWQLKFDNFIWIPGTHDVDVQEASWATCGGQAWWLARRDKVLETLTTALTDRVSLIRPAPTTHSKAVPQSGEGDDGHLYPQPWREPLLVGLQLNAETCRRLVDTGPTPDKTEEAAAFRAFWGDKSELRRFKDGTITEAVVWSSPVPERHLLVRTISEYALLRHMSLAASDLRFVAQQFDPPLFVNGKAAPDATPSILAAFESLSRTLRKLQHLPLSIASIQPSSSALSGTMVFPPLPHPLAGAPPDQPAQSPVPSICPIPIDAVIQFESTGRWPDDVTAISFTKTAFYLKIAQCLEEQSSITCSVTSSFLDAFLDGYVFRLHIYHDRELFLTHQLDPATAQTLETELVVRPQHTAMIHAVQSRFNTYATSCRLAKRWLHSHLFSGHFTDEAVDLLVAHVYVSQHQYNPPTSVISGFLRFLNLLSSFPFATEPLIVDLEQSFTQQDVDTIQREFRDTCRQRTPPPLFIAYALDRNSSRWTQSVPSQQMLSRMVAFAQRAFAFAKSCLSRDGLDSTQALTLFRTPLREYDLVLHLSPAAVPSSLQSVAALASSKTTSRKVPQGLFSTPEIRDGRQAAEVLMPGFDPVQLYVQQLKKRFGRLGEVLYDALGGLHIAIAWKPSAFVPAPIRATTTPAAIPIRDQQDPSSVKKPKAAAQASKNSAGRAVPNIVEVLVDIRRMGQGLLADISFPPHRTS